MPRNASLASMIATVEIENEYPDDIGVDQAPDFRLPFLKIAIEARVLQRDRGLRRQQFKDRDPSRRERVRRQRIFEEENPGQLLLLDQRKAEDRLRLSVAQIVVRGEQVGFGGIVENHAFPRADDIADEGFGTASLR